MVLSGWRQGLLMLFKRNNKNECVNFSLSSRKWVELTIKPIPKYFHPPSQKWNEFTRIFITSTNSPTTHRVFIHLRGYFEWWNGFVLVWACKGRLYAIVGTWQLTMFVTFRHRVYFLHVKSTVLSGQKRSGALAHTSATQLFCFEQPTAPSTPHCMVWLTTTNCTMMLCSLQKSTISWKVTSFTFQAHKNGMHSPFEIFWRECQHHDGCAWLGADGQLEDCHWESELKILVGCEQKTRMLVEGSSRPASGKLDKCSWLLAVLNRRVASWKMIITCTLLPLVVIYFGILRCDCVDAEWLNLFLGSVKWGMSSL